MYFRVAFGRVAELVECTGLENRRTLTRTGGSNPSSSARKKAAEKSAVFLCLDETDNNCADESGHKKRLRIRLSS